MSSRNAQLGIVVGVDDSPAAKVAVDWAARDAELRNVSLTLVNAVSPNLTTWWNTPLSPGVAQWQKEHGRRLLDDAVRLLKMLATAQVPSSSTLRSCRRQPFPHWLTCPKTPSW
jgi:nucleotide-binding universal stress UspA family protein